MKQKIKDEILKIIRFPIVERNQELIEYAIDLTQEKTLKEFSATIDKCKIHTFGALKLIEIDELKKELENERR